MTSRKLIIYITVFAIMALCSGLASAATFRVDQNGDPDTTYVDLTTALATVATWGGSDHIVLIEDGDYTDYGLTVPTNVAEITAVGEAANFDDPSKGTNYFLDVSGTAGLSISGLNVMNYNRGIVTMTSAATDLTVDNCDFDAVGGAFEGSVSGGSFTALEIMNGGFGILINALAGTDALDNNTVSGCYVYDMSGNGVDINSGSPVVAASMANNDITGCEIYNCQGYGAIIRIAGVGPSSGNDIVDNLVYNCDLEGVLIRGTGLLISGNTVYGCAAMAPALSGLRAIGAGNVFDNVIYNNGDGMGTGDIGLYVNGGYFDVGGNCMFGHASSQAYDVTGGNYWHNNFYGHFISIPHAIPGGGSQDWSPKTFDNSAMADPSTFEVYPDLEDTYMVDVMWTAPDCDPWDTLGLASYTFTVTFDDNYLALEDRGYDYDLFGPADGTTGAVYAPIGATTTTVTFDAANYVELAYESGRMGWLEFKGLQVGTTNITIASTYLDTLNNTITVQNTPLTITIQDTQAPSVTSFSAPSVVSDGGSGCYDANLLVTLDVEIDGYDNYDLRRLRGSFDGGGAFNIVGGISGQTGGTGGTPVTLNTTGLTEGAHTLEYWAEDDNGNTSPVQTHPFTVDRTGPVLDDAVLADNDGCAPYPLLHTDDPTVDVTLTNGDNTAVMMQLSEGTGWQTPIAYESNFDFTFTAGFPNVDLYVRLYDAYGNCGAYLLEHINVDQTVDDMTGPLSINGGAAKTNDPNVTVRPSAWNVAAGIVEYALSDNSADLTCADGNWADILALGSPYVAPFTLSGDDGTKTIYCAVRDSAGNISAILSDDIEYDTTPPDLLSFDVLEECAGSRWVHLEFTWDDAVTDAQWLLISEDGGAPWRDTIDISAEDPTAATAMYLLSNSGDGDYTVTGTLVDDIGNVSTALMSDDVTLDRGDPTMTAIALNGGDNWFNGGWTVDVSVSDPSTDAEWILMGEATGVYTDTVAFDGSDVTYTFQNQTECTWLTVYAVLMDCAGNTSTEYSDAVAIDLTDPVVNTVTINGVGDGQDSTRTRNVTIDFTYTETCNAYRMMVSEDAAFTGATWETVVSTGYAFTLTDPGDGVKTVYVKLMDRAGNESAAVSDDIYLDETPPTASLYIWQPSNPHAASGYTNNRVGNQVVITDYSDDGYSIYFRDKDNNLLNSGGYINPIPATYDLWTLVVGNGVKTVEYRVRDNVGNTSAWMEATIIFDNIAPAAITGGTMIATPGGGSCKLEWDGVADAQKYYIRYNYSNEYPTYENFSLHVFPPHPAVNEGHELEQGDGWVFDTEFNFEGPQMDVYAFSAWTCDSAGNMSAAANQDVVTTNYVLSDLDWNDVVEFGADLGELGATYWLTTADAGFNPEVDYGPTHDGQRDGVPRPDGVIDFWDLVVASSNYAVFGDFNGKRGFDPIQKLNVQHKVEIATQLPERISKGQEFTFSITNDNPSVIMAFHLAFDCGEKLEIVKVETGDMINSVDKTFFFKKIEGTELLMDGAAFGQKNLFEGTEIAHVTVRATADITRPEIKDQELIVRDWDNNDAEVSFNVTLKDDPSLVVPTEFGLSQNYPNPFNPATTIELALPQASNYRLEIYNIAGQVVESFTGYSEAGIVTVNWDAGDLASGVYFYRAKAGNFTETRKMVLIK